MATAIITTDAVFGPWIIPARGQTMIANNYARNNNISVDAVFPEPVFSDLLSTTRWYKKDKELTRGILCSIHQLPQKMDNLDCFLDDLQDIEFHFSLEALSGKGREFLSQMIEEARIFMETEIIDYDKVNSYQDLFDIMQKQTVVEK